MKTGLVWHDDYMRYDSGAQGILESPHPFFEPLPTIDHPLAKRRLKTLLDRTGLTDLLVPITPRHASREELLRCHDGGYLDRIAGQSASGGGEGGESTPFGAGSFEIATLSAGGVLAAVDAMMSGEVDRAYALVHPPGHHARPALGVGFCLLANGPLAVQYAREIYGVSRVAVVDWDVHHGNSAQEIFWRDPAVLAISLHQADWYPRASGAVGEIGEDNGEGFTLNIPLPAGAGEEAYVSAMTRAVLPALRAFSPDFILLAAGYDAGMFDPLGRMRLNSGSFSRMMHQLVEVADEVCGGKIIVTQEGGYDASSVPFHGLATIEALSGISTGIENPFAYPAPQNLDDLRAEERTAIAEVEANLRIFRPRWEKIR